jgi:hypothetical protein
MVTKRYVTKRYITKWYVKNGRALKMVHGAKAYMTEQYSYKNGTKW